DVEDDALPTLGEDAITGPLHPPGTRADIPAVDLVIEAVENGEAGTLASMVAPLSIPCGEAEGPGGPPSCPEGTEPGTPVEVLPAASCEREYVPPATLQEWLGGQFFAGDRPGASLQLFAVVDGSNAMGDEQFPAGDFIAVFGFPDGLGRSVHVSAEGIVRVE